MEGHPTWGDEVSSAAAREISSATRPLTPDPDFTLVAGRPIVDFAVDDDGVYWLETDGISSAIGILATSSDAVP